MNVPINNKFGVLLAEKRMKEKRNIPLSEVHEKTGISRPTLQAWANNTVTRFDLSVIEGLCEYFDVKLSDLLEYEPPSDHNHTARPKHKAVRK
jgi:DNA-binding Xre family transcriptional regulator